MIKKSDLYASLWSSCDELRGGMDASQYKDYVLTLLFMKYVTDKYAGQADALIEVPEGGSFADMVTVKGDKEIGDKINKIIGRLADANDLRGVIDVADFNDEDKLGRGKEMQDRLTKLVGIFEGLDLRSNRAEGDDLLGDAYEYLMRHFATESGKSKGQFYTPAEVSRVMAKVVGVSQAKRRDQTIYDPTCGSGSLLLKAADEAPRGITIYGQENDNATWALARMNMILHGHPTADLWRGNTLAAPYFKNPRGGLKTFDFAVANPPFSAKAWTTGFDPKNDEFNRFELGVPPAKNGDYAFLLHVIASLKSTGKAAVILPHGVLFRGNREADIRRNLLKQGLIKGIIGLPPNLFYGTGIPACVVVVDKEGASERAAVFLIDASRDFMKDGNKNRLRSQDIHKIVDVFTRHVQIPGYSRLVPLSAIADPTNDYNLNLSRYIEPTDLEDVQDLEAHLKGGIPERDVEGLHRYWSALPALRGLLFEDGNGARAGYTRVRIPSEDVHRAILEHPEFARYLAAVRGIVDAWQSHHRPSLEILGPGVLPRQIIGTLSEDLLSQLGAVPPLDAYDAYQRLMDYWTDVMQDDVYLIAAAGWRGAAQLRAIANNGGRRIKESPDLALGKVKYKADLIPPDLVVRRFFPDEIRKIAELEARAGVSAGELSEFLEEAEGEDDLLEEARNEKGTVTKALMIARLKLIRDDPEFADETAALERCRELLDAVAASAKTVREARAALDVKTVTQYRALTEEDVKALVVQEKWFATISATIDEEAFRPGQALSQRVRELEERYLKTLPDTERDVAELTSTVHEHLRVMGLDW